MGDCPALKLILSFINHQGYNCCFFCNIRGAHIPDLHKRQYYYRDAGRLRDAKAYAEQSIEAETAKTNVNGHLGVSVLHGLLDTPLPEAIMIDYLHVSLLRHAKAIFTDLYRRLKPVQRTTLNLRLRDQPMPHHFNRRLIPLCDLSFSKGTELRNNLFYAILPLLIGDLSIEILSHLALFVCAIRLWHSAPILDARTNEIASELFRVYYQDHESFYRGLQNFVLHIHSHFGQQHTNFGALSYTSTFAQEDLIGHVSVNRHGSQHHGDLIAYYYSLDFALHNRMVAREDPDDCLIDQCNGFDIDQFTQIASQHASVCTCSSTSDCVVVFRRCRLRQKIYHSLLYTRCTKSNSYFVNYNGNGTDSKHGRIALFFSCRNHLFALIHHHQSDYPFSDEFVSSKYYYLLREPIDRLFAILQRESSTRLECIPVGSINTHSVVFDLPFHLVATPVASENEHD